MTQTQKIIEITTESDGFATVYTPDETEAEVFENLHAALAFAYGLRLTLRDRKVAARIHVDGTEYTPFASLI
ncbi:hypothetical protein ACM25N_07785 [Roseovarius sp. C7]|uniref:hypothetical protein n=1 Tax=Roseovarius sp. C7 TaxID=3398643 RepID=UPI0039F660B2